MRLLYLPNQYSQQRQHEKPVWIYPVLLAMQAEWHRKQGHEVKWLLEGDMTDYKTIREIITTTGGISSNYPNQYDRIITEPQFLPFLELPAPDRIFTHAFDKKYQKYGNYKYHPATHMQVANGCWHGNCTFCVENQNKYEVRPLDDVMAEIEECHRLGFKEIFDDSGTFPKGEWLNDFIHRLDSLGVHNCSYGCNLRICEYPFHDMRRVGFRMVLFGIESANQKTLDKINKGVKVEDIISTLKRASEAGLEPHGAFMFGFPWESEKEELATLNLCHYLLRKGYLKTAQASVYTVNGQRGVDRGFVKRIYEVALCPEFWIRKVKDLQKWQDLLYLLKSIKKGIIRD